ncbi:AraC family transcriptional regulator [Paenibacillus doosanensis]|uniref:helix-turn-helix domain-containing protein n=1 Tax=Paenibacillus doosanensis TaxID=1229154 RepID=UPI00217F9A70|nr:AraC family transcriptional regulator [Paenibacillus doosanensis]MCS7463296.1 AraC family transcriptional regulator [Paenibacillus doosanensis]
MSGAEGRWQPEALSHTYWHLKEAFLLKEDTYDYWVMFAVEEGSFRYTIGEAQGQAGFGDLILCPPGTAFEREVIAPLSFHFYTLRWKPAQGARAEGQAAPDTVLPVHVRLTGHGRLSATYALMRQMASLANQPERMRQWTHFGRDLWQQYALEQELAELAGRQPADDPAMRRAQEWLRRHAFGPVVLKRLSRELGLSPVQFTRRFQAAYRITPMDYLTSLRIQLAQRLLLETDWTLERIAEQCGYENGFYLSRVFSKTMNMSPSQFRSRHRV